MSKRKQTEKKPLWFSLDNAAKIFPAQNTSTWSNSFRVQMELDRKINPAVLRAALEAVMPRFPSYGVKIRRGFFWFYLEKNENPLTVHPDIKNPLYRVNFKENGRYLFRVYYHGSRIAVDCYHVLTDGHGGAVFLSTLAAEYLRREGEKIPAGGFSLSPDAPPTPEETEDSFVRSASSEVKKLKKDGISYHVKADPMPDHTVNVTSGILSFAAFHRLTKEKNVTVTEYLAALMLSVLLERQKRDGGRKKQVAVQIPVDLRRVFGGETLRNFTICMLVKVDPNKGEYSFDELLELTKYQLRLQNTMKEHNASITANLQIERNPFVRFAPLFLKNFFISIGFAIAAEQTSSALITNLGKVELPEELARHVKKFLFMPAPGKLNPARLGVATVNDSLVITFSNSFVQSDVERAFFTAFVKQGLHVKIESNRE